MTAANQQLITCYEELGMTPEEIAQDQDLDIAAVKSTLMQFSSKYRKDCKINDDLVFTDDEAKRAKDIIMQLAQYSEDENLRFRAARYIRDDKKGRLDIVQQMAGLNINVISMNEQMRKALLAVNKAKGVIEAEVTKINDGTDSSSKS